MIEINNRSTIENLIQSVDEIEYQFLATHQAVQSKSIHLVRFNLATAERIKNTIKNARQHLASYQPGSVNWNVIDQNISRLMNIQSLLKKIHNVMVPKLVQIEGGKSGNIAERSIEQKFVEIQQGLQNLVDSREFYLEDQVEGAVEEPEELVFEAEYNPNPRISALPCIVLMVFFAAVLLSFIAMVNSTPQNRPFR